MIIPIFNAPDEPFHFEYIQFIAQNKAIPNQTVEEKSIATEGFNPPLYYSINALFLSCFSKDKASDIKIHTHQDIAAFFRQPSKGFGKHIYPPLNPRYIKWGRGSEKNMFLTTDKDTFPFSGSIGVVHILRMISILFGALTLFFIFKTTRLLFPANQNIPLLAASLCAFNPQFNFLSGSLNNDNLVIVWATVALWLITKLLVSESDDKRMTIGLLGIVIGLGFITKINIASIALVAVIAILYTFTREKPRKARDLSIHFLLFLAPIAAIAGWYFVRNVCMYGFNDVMGWHLMARQNPGLVLPPQYRAMVFKKIFFQRLFTSFWGLFDWLTIPLPSWMYWIYGVISMFGIAGIVAFFKGTPDKKGIKSCMMLYLLAILFTFVNLVVLNFTFLSAQARLIFPTLACISLFIAIGIDGVLHRLSRLLKANVDYFFYSFIGLIIGLNLYTLFWIIYPVYR
ncbi:MAG: DUF2142 domain-containing protein [bacterium]